MTEEKQTKKCPFCAEEIPSKTEICPHCKEQILNNEKNNKKQDPVFDIKLKPTWLLLLCAVIALLPMQIFWLLFGGLEKPKEFSYRMCRFINSLTIYESNKVSEVFLWNLLIAVVIVIPFCYYFSPEIFSDESESFIYFWILGCYIATGVISLKYAKIIEEHIYNYHNVIINLNKFGVFVLQAIYLNYFLLSYKDRIDQAKRYRGI